MAAVAVRIGLAGATVRTRTTNPGYPAVHAQGRPIRIERPVGFVAIGGSEAPPYVG